MNFTDLKTELTYVLQQAMIACLGNDYAETDPLIQFATRPEFGDFQANVAMSLAKTLQTNPFDLASRIVEYVGRQPLISAISVVKPGFINITVSDEAVLTQLQALKSPRYGVPALQQKETVVVDYGGPNAAKAMHVGHLRSAIIGDAIYRILDFLGYHVIRQNHIGDWGTQFGMLIEYMLEANIATTNLVIDDLNQLYQKAKAKFDVDADFALRARHRVALLQNHEAKTKAIWDDIIAISVDHFQAIYQTLHVRLTSQDICGESFYQDQLAKRVSEFEQAGLAVESDGAKVIFLEGYQDADGKAVPFLIQKSDGAYLYATTDLAAAKYRICDLAASRVIYVTDARQAQHFAMLFDCVKKMPWAEQANLQHVPFGSILGADKKPFKTRAGDVIKLTDLLSEAKNRAGVTAKEKNSQLHDADVNHIADVIGIGALKFADLVNDKVKDYVFDWDKMLAFEGKTAPYLINAYVRIQAIFRKLLPDQWHQDAALVISDPFERKLMMKLLGFAPTVVLVSQDLAIHKLCHYLYELAATFHGFYEHCPILTATTPEILHTRLYLCQETSGILKQGLALLGIDVLEHM